MHAVKQKKGTHAQQPGNTKNASSQTSVRMHPRRKINPSSPPTMVEIHGIRVHFPFKPYPCQELYMKKVMDALLRGENALLESPTGTGKTLCLLCACLAWQREQARCIQQEAANALTQSSSSSSTTNDTRSNKKNALQKSPSPPRVPTIIYASRTHSQLSQVVRELRSTRYRPTHALLGSREQMCVNPKVKKVTSTASDINHDCNKLGKERKCRYRNNLEGYSAPPNEVGAGDELQPVMDMEDLLTMGKKDRVCPFYYTRGVSKDAELVLLPYNYLFDKDARTTTLAEIPWNNAIVIFDEAHNLETFASESASFDLSNSDVAGCIAEVSKAINYMHAMSDTSFGVSLENLVRLKAVFLKFESYIMNLGDQTAFSGEFMMDLFEKGCLINFSNHEIFIDELRKVNDLLMDIRGTGATRGSPRLEHFVQCIKRVFSHNTEARCLAKAAFYRVHVSPKPTQFNRNTVGRTISYWCFAPSLAMEELANLNVRSILVTSGTLSPLPSYSMELGIRFPHTLENTHVIADSQIHVRVIGRGSTGKPLCSSFERRKDGEYYSELGNTLVELAEVVPGGLLIFFPSYAVMETCLERWGGPTTNRSRQKETKGDFFSRRTKANNTTSNQYSFPYAALPYFDQQDGSRVTPWRSLLGKKAIVVEPKGTSDLNDAIAEFKRNIELPKSRGCILMGVCRGKISEGLSFAHEQSRAVVITGLPFPPSHDPKVRMKQEYLDRSRATSKIKSSDEGGFAGSSTSTSQKLSGREWYTQQAHRAVNQAIGRVIRNKDDYGAVLLLDYRFDQAQNRNGLSKWLRPHIKNDEGLKVAKDDLARFYKQAEESYRRISRAAAESVVLQYEDDEPLLGSKSMITKVALIRASGGSDINADSAFVAPDQVIAKLDIEEMQKPQNAEAVSVEMKDPANDTKKPVSHDDIFVGNQSAPVQGSASIVSSGAQSAKTSVAAQFFGKAKDMLDANELSSIKKAIVAMKRHGDSKDVRSYTNAASVIVKLVLQHESLEATIKKGAESALFLFFRLLPHQFRANVEAVALKVAFDGSILGALCKENLPTGHFKLVQSYMVSLLQAMWCSADEELLPGVYLSKAQDVLALILNTDRPTASAMLNAYIKLVSPRLVNITISLSNELTASIAMEKMKKVEKIKTGEASMNKDRFTLPSWQTRVNGSTIDKSDAGATRSPTTGHTLSEAVSNTSLSKPNTSGTIAPINPYVKKPGPIIKKQPNSKVSLHHAKPMGTGQVSKTNGKAIGSSVISNPHATDASVESGHSNEPVLTAPPVKRKLDDGNFIVNPYAKKQPSTYAASKLSETASASAQLAQPLPATESGLPSQEPRVGIENSNITSLISSIEADPFTKSAPAEVNIQSNAPKNLTCPICSNRCESPCLADCGHMACLSCWKHWLCRSQTCPTCRLPTTQDNIARMVYEKQPDSRVPSTLSQLKSVNGPTMNTERNDEAEDSESDEELVIC